MANYANSTVVCVSSFARFKSIKGVENAVESCAEKFRQQRLVLRRMAA